MLIFAADVCHCQCINLCPCVLCSSCVISHTSVSHCDHSTAITAISTMSISCGCVLRTFHTGSMLDTFTADAQHFLLCAYMVPLRPAVMCLKQFCSVTSFSYITQSHHNVPAYCKRSYSLLSVSCLFTVGVPLLSAQPTHQSRWGCTTHSVPCVKWSILHCHSPSYDSHSLRYKPTPSSEGLGFDSACPPGFRTQLHVTTSLSTGGGPVSYVQLSGGVSRWFTPLACGPGSPELSKSDSDG